MPQRKKDKQRKEMRSSLSVGEKIITIGGIRGRIVKTYETSVIISVGKENTKLEIMRWAIGERIGDADAKKSDKNAKTEEKEETTKKPKRLGFGVAKPRDEEEEVSTAPATSDDAETADEEPQEEA
jgi:preprotein translocase YajC subunit